MKFILLGVLAICGAALSQRNPNPCEGVPGIDQFRNDWASCEDYFWCNNGVAVPVPTPCPPLMGFDEVNQGCSVDQNPCLDCPEEGNLAVSFLPFNHQYLHFKTNRLLTPLTHFVNPFSFVVTAYDLLLVSAEKALASTESQVFAISRVTCLVDQQIFLQ